MKHFKLLFVVLLCTSCQFFETEKISSETFYESAVKTIDWNNVDSYPVFSACEALSEKPKQKQCFENELAYQLHQRMMAQGVKALKDVNDTIVLSFAISENAKISILHMQIDSVLQKEFPHLQDSLLYSMGALELVAPAYKRGIPVKTQFTLPILVTTQD
ncbi:hypothetical protein [Marinirhabdus gelatinilytica]|uniref:TonB-like protein n=1 Tax=Marinirhabdus gelatinilytica TaxID=1703343 RepID=A0A370QKI9_9FLAO|nr:hypothetical protein [Marinirhabdus gelatinilytica]RDK88883.1 hypothetical protein C8D94_101761 [Marinirhabdus gelatinilytica]